jgi:hypothetical protein
LLNILRINAEEGEKPQVEDFYLTKEGSICFSSRTGGEKRNEAILGGILSALYCLYNK